MAQKRIDELNILGNKNSSDVFDREEFIDHYFDSMQISKKQKKNRIDAAKDIFDAVLLFLIWCENAPKRVQEESTQRSFENMYKEVIFQYSEPDNYFDIYVPLFIANLIQTTLDHQGEDYFYSIERAANVACNESNTVCNYAEVQDAKSLGYTHKQWVAELDERTRLDHIEQDGVVVPIDDYFIFEDCLMFMAHDEVNGTAKQCVNCRCSTKYLKIDDRYYRSGALSGAYNDINDPNNENREKVANALYTQFINRNRDFEIEAVAKNSGYSVEEVNRIYDHIFIRQHLFEDGSVHKFDPDYYMAHSWMRLRTGQNIQEHDLMMLRHELEEEKIMGESLEIPYEIAHNEVEIKGYSYTKLLLEYLKTHDV